ncbi:membrane protein insertion efficiency factor YidD [Serinibacter arcticus]|uniref:membrane protein insertion efficiency factor YidD n=1 Tax=Serinibacter arcticus TaxID=1655435 RepID=UPI001F15DF96|nr:membrane protein insertion efficiency factor YidD [Serinibacter arcticus]
MSARGEDPAGVGSSESGSVPAPPAEGTDDRSPSFVSRVLVAAVRGYQLAISPLLGPRCRFYPSCSAYAVMSLRERGAGVGTVLAVYRVLRCNPWARGGVDFPPRRGERWPGWDGVVERDATAPPSHSH